MEASFLHFGGTRNKGHVPFFMRVFESNSLRLFMHGEKINFLLNSAVALVIIISDTRYYYHLCVEIAKGYG